MTTSFLAVVNKAAGHGRCGKLAGPALDRLKKAGVAIDTVETHYTGHGSELVRDAYRRGYRRFIAVGGDGTSYEIVNGLFPLAGGDEQPTLAFLPLGTGNSFLRDFTDQGESYAVESLVAGRIRACDVLRLKHRDGVLHSINLLSIGFAADVAALTNRKFKSLGELGYVLGVLTCLARLQRRTFPLRADGEPEFDRRRCLFLSFNNSKFTGGTMMIAPRADVSDGLIEYVRWGPIGRAGLLWNLHRLYDGTHVSHAMASRRAVQCVEFDWDGPVDVMVDGESLTIQCEKLDVLPSALHVVI